jgi:hypothetical protein
VDRERYLSLRAPVIFLILAFTSIPTEWRRPDAAILAEAVSFGLDIPDIVANVIGFVPVGLVLAGHTTWKGIGFAGALSVFAETMQLFSRGRSPSIMDVASNVAGACLGIALCAFWRRDVSRIRLGRRPAVVAAVGAAVVVWMLAARIATDDFARLARTISAMTGLVSMNARGATEPGRLEGAWSFDAPSGRSVADESGNGLTGVLVRSPGSMPGVHGAALSLNGRNQWVDLGKPDALRLTGSMTISAWINSTAFPRDDAAIVSAHNGFGFQLDTTIDQGPRTIGFKLSNDHGQLMMRYGRTRLSTNRWYYVAGVYDAASQTMNVYLDGRLDNGCLSGVVTPTQWMSGEKTFIGRRAGERGFEFAGLIDDVRIYSRALTQSEVAGEAQGAGAESSAIKDAAGGACVAPAPEDSLDDRIAGPAALLGVLAACIVAGFWPLAGWRIAALLVSGVVGLAVVPVVAPLVPAYFRLLVPLLALAGGFSVIASVVRRDTGG